MHKRIYGDYVDFISKAMSSTDFTQLRDDFQKRASIGQLDEGKLSKGQEQDLPIPTENHLGVDKLGELLNIYPVKKPQIGDHPDFLYLRYNRIGTRVKHYITSMFIDVKGSTNLYRKYNHEQIYYITQMIILAGTHTCALFGGHIQRLQGDGIFAYFGGKSVDKNVSVESAIKAASFFNYFMQYELKGIFSQYEIENIYARIGIDFGDDKDVEWAVFGSQSCTELTTLGLHTSLAAKMQGYADNNGIMVGDNVKTRLNGKSIYCDFIRNKFGNIDTDRRYIYEDPKNNFHYGQSKYNWVAYLQNTYHFVKTDTNGGLYIDWEAKENAKEQARIDSLTQKTALLNTNNAFIDSKGGVTASNTGVQIKPNNFYYDATKV